MSQQDEDKEVYEKLKVLLEEALERDKVLREKFKAGDKFDIVPKKLQNILAEVEENLKKIAGLALSSKARRPDVLAADETVVYVYLFNGSGKDLSSWLSMFTKDALFGYSVNRPIYGEREHIEKLLESRMPLENNAALAMRVKKTDVVQQEEAAFAHDPLEQPLIRVREGVFKVENIQYFQHTRQQYRVDERGKLRVKK